MVNLSCVQNTRAVRNETRIREKREKPIAEEKNIFAIKKFLKTDHLFKRQLFSL